MTTETVLTDEQIQWIGSGARLSEYGGALAFARAIERAVLESDEVKRAMEDAERVDWMETTLPLSRSGIGFDWRNSYSEGGQVVEKGGIRFMKHHSLGERKPTLRAAIDAARGKK
ncbi:hypothetical protein ACMSSJ_11415 [Kerstersia gyiorum]|uniref:hypothetical protein n=1 Tax=Kerstersia gyiorum TaxID=206506 RepID=UPI0039E8B10E